MPDIMNWQDTIQYLVSGHEPICTIEWIADECAVSPPTVYAWKNQGNEPKISQAIALNKALIKEKNCHIIEKLFYVRRTDDRADGKIRDDLWKLHELSTFADRHYADAKQGKPKARQKYFDTVQAMKEEVTDLEAEGSSL